MKIFFTICILLLITTLIGQKYIVQKGDNLWDISKRCTGSPYNWIEIWQNSNTKNITTDPNVIYPGMELVIRNSKCDSTNNSNCCEEGLNLMKESNAKIAISNHHLKRIADRKTEISINSKNDGSYFDMNAIINSIIAGLLVTLLAHIFLIPLLKGIGIIKNGASSELPNVNAAIRNQEQIKFAFGIQDPAQMPSYDELIEEALEN